MLISGLCNGFEFVTLVLAQNAVDAEQVTIAFAESLEAFSLMPFNDAELVFIVGGIDQVGHFVQLYLHFSFQLLVLVEFNLFRDFFLETGADCINHLQ